MRVRKRGAFLDRNSLLHVGLDLGAGETGFSHDTANARIIKNGDDKLLDLDLEGENGLLLVLNGAAALVGLSPLEGCNEGVGEGREVGLRGEERGRGGGGEAVEGDVEAELEGFALQGVGMGLKASPLQQTCRRSKHGACYMKRGHLGVAAPPSQAHRLLHNPGSFYC